MHRRALLRLAIATAGSLASAQERPYWSSLVNGLRLGLRVDSQQRNLFLSLNNAGSTPLDVFVASSPVWRFDFTATAPGGSEYPITDRALFIPCAGLCGLPTSERIVPAATLDVTFSLEDLLHLPEKGPDTNLRDLMRRGYSVRVAFQVTETQLKDAALSLDCPWLGHLIATSG